VLSDGDGNPRGICNSSGQWGFNGLPQSGNQVTANFVSGSYGFAAFYGSASGTGFFHNFAYNGSQVGSISSTGTITVYNTTSDYRLKNNPVPLTGSGAFIDALQPKTWDWAQDGSRGAGFIAHEFAEVSPSSVNGTKDAVDTEGKPVYQAMQASSAEVIANLVAEIQSLRKRLADAGI